ncbi:MAG: alpha/beta hydrolase [Chitinophagaceae bacterium]|nr:alpha/beta hydrolase [Chitinophagaceae bacterium]
MKIQSFLLTLFIVFQYTLPAQTSSFTGTWSGTIQAGQSLRIVFHIKNEPNGRWMATMDSPDQGGYGIGLDSVIVNGSSIRMKINSMRIGYEGSLVNDTLLQGHFIQVVKIPLTLTKNVNNESVTSSNSSARPYPEEEITEKAGGVTLSGSLVKPAGDAGKIAVLLIAGSGPTDRNGNTPLLPGGSNSLLQLADSLAAHGIASLRYDKRGVGKSKLTDNTSVSAMTIEDIAADAEILFNLLRQRGYKRILIAGHSEGSLIGLLIANKVKADGFISLAGAGRKAGILLKEQTKSQFPDKLFQEFTRALDSLENGLRVKKVNPALLSLLAPAVQPYLQSWLPLDPAELIASLSCPALIVQGTKDLQVTQADAQALHTANPAAKLLLVDDMNHVLKTVRGNDRAANSKAYTDPSLPLPADLIKAIVTFAGN